MRPLGFLFVFLSIAVGYEGMRGRSATDLGGDFKDAAVALITGDVKGAQEAFSRPPSFSPNGPVGDAGSVGRGAAGGKLTSGGADSSAGARLLLKMQALGSVAKGYRLGSTGPTYYDCSGIVWRAMKDLGMYDGPRFTTATFVLQMGGRVKEVSVPGLGVIVLWRKLGAGHMGVMTDDTNCYSARSPKSGIKVGANSIFTGLYGKPRYFVWIV